MKFVSDVALMLGDESARANLDQNHKDPLNMPILLRFQEHEMPLTHKQRIPPNHFGKSIVDLVKHLPFYGLSLQKAYKSAGFACRFFPSNCMNVK